MDITGTYTFDAPPERVWALLMDPAVISSCIPGCEQLRAGRRRSLSRAAHGRHGGDHRHLRRHGDDFRQGGADVVPAGGRRAGPAGIREGQRGDHAARRRRRRPIVDVTGTVQTGGTIARLGQRLIGSVAKMMQDRFFACLQGEARSSRPTTGPTRYDLAIASSSARRANTGIIALR